jgi:hypothetical protein
MEITNMATISKDPKSFTHGKEKFTDDLGITVENILSQLNTWVAKNRHLTRENPEVFIYLVNFFNEIKREITSQFSVTIYSMSVGSLPSPRPEALLEFFIDLLKQKYIKGKIYFSKDVYKNSEEKSYKFFVGVFIDDFINAFKDKLSQDNVKKLQQIKTQDFLGSAHLSDDEVRVDLESQNLLLKKADLAGSASVFSVSLCQTNKFFKRSSSVDSLRVFGEATDEEGDPTRGSAMGGDCRK